MPRSFHGSLALFAIGLACVVAALLYFDKPSPSAACLPPTAPHMAAAEQWLKDREPSGRCSR